MIKFVNDKRQVDKVLVLVADRMAAGRYGFTLYDRQQLGRLAQAGGWIRVELPADGKRGDINHWLRLLDSRSGRFHTVDRPGAGLPVAAWVNVNDKAVMMVISRIRVPK